VLLDLLEKVSHLTTNCHIVGYDFDYLPPCAEGDLNSPVNCINGPIVCSYENGITLSLNWFKGTCTDKKTYLANKYKNDIFFSTDFITLSAVVGTLTRNTGHVGLDILSDPKIEKVGNFMKENTQIVKTRTMLGWNPLLKDFKNLSFIVS